MMKNKYSLMFIVLIMTIFSCFGQDLRFSFMASPQLVWMEGNDQSYESKGSLAGLNTGIEMDYFFSENYAFSTGLTLNWLGGRVVYEDSLYLGPESNELLLLPGSRIDYRIQYLSIPVGLKFKTVEIGYTTFWINTGLTPMINVKSRATDENETFVKTDMRDETGLLNLNYFIEGGVEYSLGGNTCIVGGLGFSSGLMDVTNRPGEKLTTQALTLVLGIQF